MTFPPHANPADTQTKMPAQARQVFLEVLEEKRNKNPLLPLKIGAEEVLQKMIDALKNEHGVQIESLVCATMSKIPWQEGIDIAFASAPSSAKNG